MVTGGQRKEAQMNRLITLLGLVLLATIFFVGCDEVVREAGESRVQITEVDAPPEVGLTPVEQRKAELLARIERKFERPEAHFELGKLYQADGLWDKAEYEYGIVLRFMPSHREAQATLVKLLLERGDQAKADHYAARYMKQVGDSAYSSVVLGHAFQKQRLDNYAHECYQQALKLAPNSAKIYKQIGYHYLSRNDRTRAAEYLKHSFQLDPYQPEVAGELGRLGIVVKVPQGAGHSPPMPN
jgi:Flp pilus assembly protein TadD